LRLLTSSGTSARTTTSFDYKSMQNSYLTHVERYTFQAMLEVHMGHARPY
jgi:hypothetical protein